MSQRRKEKNRDLHHTDWYLAKHFSSADQVLALFNGQIKYAATYTELLQDGLPDVADTTCTNDGDDTGMKEHRDPRPDAIPKEEASPRRDGTNAAADDARATGEWSTYKYYFKSIGLRDGSLFFVMTALSSFFMSFGSEWSNERQPLRFRLTRMQASGFRSGPKMAVMNLLFIFPSTYSWPF